MYEPWRNGCGSYSSNVASISGYVSTNFQFLLIEQDNSRAWPITRNIPPMVERRFRQSEELSSFLKMQRSHDIKWRRLRIVRDYAKTACMANIRPEVSKFISACEHLFGFTHASGRLTADECSALEYYADELRKQIAPVCVDPQAHCHEQASSSS